MSGRVDRGPEEAAGLGGGVTTYERGKEARERKRGRGGLLLLLLLLLRPCDHPFLPCVMRP